MDTILLQKWLGLPPGLWPPEPHILLGVKRGSDANAVQDRALAQMEKLRPHQLMNPELVTEGMNRLAQAIMAMEAAVKPVTPVAPPAEPEFRFDLGIVSVPPKSKSAVIVDAEVVDAVLLTETNAETPPKPLRRKKRRRRTIEALPKVGAIEVLPPAGVALSNRRQAYRQLVQLRRELRSWELLGPFFGVPSRVPVLSSEVFQLLDALQEARSSLRDKHFRGNHVRTLVHQGVPLATLRSLLKSQRQALASDWATGFAELQGQFAALRQLIRQSKPAPTSTRRVKRLGARLGRHPEWKLVFVLLIALGVAVVRLTRTPGH